MIQKRYDGSLSYYKGFNEYAEGFGSVEGEHWLGILIYFVHLSNLFYNKQMVVENL